MNLDGEHLLGAVVRPGLDVPNLVDDASQRAPIRRDCWERPAERRANP
jgi:hypothetical protein